MDSIPEVTAPTTPRCVPCPPAFASAPRRMLAKNAELFAEGDVADCFFFVVSGALRCSKVTSDGRRQIDTFLLPGDILGLDGYELRRFTAEAVEETVVACAGLATLDRLIDTDPAFRALVLSAMMANLERTRARILLLGRMTPRERLLSFLKEMAGRLGHLGHFELPLPRTDIADHLGLAKETLSRTLTKLAREGRIVIGTTGRRIALINAPTV